MQIQNLKSKKIPKPIAPNPPSQINPIPPANFAEEEAAIAQAQMKLTQALSLVEARTPLLKSENPERRAEVEKADAVFQQAAQKVEEQRQLLQSMRDLKLQDEIIQHEQAKLKALEGEQEQARSALKQAQAKLNASAIDQLQQLQQLQIAVRIAQSELELAQSRLLASQSRRQMVEYAANVNAAEREQKQQQLQQEYNRQLQFYSQALSDRDYQLAQLGISLTAIDDKLAQIPIVRSPQDGFIRRIQPWTGNNGKYSTTVIISDTVINKPSNPGASSSTNSSTTSTGTNWGEVNLDEQPPSEALNEEQPEQQVDPEQAESESDSVVPKTEQNPFSKPNIDKLIQTQFTDDMWRIMRGGLPCLETSSNCLQQLQERAVGQSPLLKEIDARIAEANQRVEEAKQRNQKVLT